MRTTDHFLVVRANNEKPRPRQPPKPRERDPNKEIASLREEVSILRGELLAHAAPKRQSEKALREGDELLDLKLDRAEIVLQFRREMRSLRGECRKLRARIAALERAVRGT